MSVADLIFGPFIAFLLLEATEVAGHARATTTDSTVAIRITRPW